jgi:hypothetical protein
MSDARLTRQKTRRTSPAAEQARGGAIDNRSARADNAGMLLPDQVIPFLSADDALVRAHAVDYFTSAGDFGSLTGDGVWAAMDAVGLEAANACGLVEMLRQAPPTDASSQRLLAALDANPADGAIRSGLIDEIRFMPLGQLRRHRERVLGRTDLPESIRGRLEERLRVAELPMEELWALVLGPATAKEADEATDATEATEADESEEFDEDDGPADAAGDDLDYEDDPDDDEEEVEGDGDDEFTLKYLAVDALAELGGDAVGGRALAILNDPARRDTDAEDLAVDLLGRVRHRPALGRLLERFAEADDTTTSDFLLEAMQDALPRFGADAVGPIEAAFTTASPSYRIYAAEALGRVKHPSSEAALLRLVKEPGADDAWDEVAHSLMKLISAEAMPALYEEIVVAQNFSGMVYDLERELVASALMVGYEFPELGAMREEALARDVEDAQARAGGELGGAYRDVDDWEDDEPGYPALPERLDDQYPAATLPIKNEAPKVGRNDPCPCGSGKKYKKCCLGKA